MTCDTPAPNPDDILAIYPSGSVPEVRTGPVSALCSYGITPQVMTGALVQLFRQYFADANNVRSHTLREFVIREGLWHTENADRGLYIDDIANWNPELTQSRPAIIIKDGDWTYRSVGIGDRAGADFVSGEEYFSGYWYGSHSVFSIGAQGPETKLLAIECARALLYFKQTVANQLELHRFALVKLGAAAPLKEATERYIVPIDVAYVVNETWTVQREAPRLKRLEFSATQLGL